MLDTVIGGLTFLWAMYLPRKICDFTSPTTLNLQPFHNKYHGLRILLRIAAKFGDAIYRCCCYF